VNLRQFSSFFLFCIPVVAGAQWTWRNPLPQGNPLYVLRINENNQSVWAGGTVGTVMHSEDQGVTWHVSNLIKYTKSVAVVDLSFPDDSTVIAVDRYGFIFKSTNSGNTWDTVYKEKTVGLNGCCFSNAVNGYIVGDNGKLLRTTDAGEFWTSQNVTPQVNFKAVAFPDDSTGYACGYHYIMKTVDGGSTWNTVHDDATATMNSMVFASPTTGWAAGDSGCVMMTNDGGATWNVQHLGDTIHITSIAMFSPDTLMINAIDNGIGLPYHSPAIYRSTDGGLSWIRLSLPHDHPYTYAVACLPGGKAFTAGEAGYLFATDDYGNTWNSLENFIVMQLSWGYSILGIDFPSQNTGYAVTGGLEGPVMKVMKTTDGGDSWIALDSSFSNYSNTAIDFVTDETGYICGNDIYSTNDGGQTWIRRYTGTGYQSLRAMSFADLLVGVAVGDDGRFLRTTDRGQSWGQVSGVPNVTYKSVHFPDALTGYAAGTTTILKTTDAGATWNLVCSDYYLNALWFTDDQTGFGVGNSGLIVHTTDGGLTWDTIDSPTTLKLFAVHFYDTDTGYIAGGSYFFDGFVLKTTDKGMTWKIQAVPTSVSLYTIRTTGSSAFVGGLGCYLFGTTNGGIAVRSDQGVFAIENETEFFPNPFSDHLQIRYILPAPADVVISIFDTRGVRVLHQRVLMQTAGEHTHTMISGGLMPGIYIARIHYNGRTENRKIVLMR